MSLKMNHKKRWVNKPNKEGSRQHLFSHVSKPIDAGLFFPGSGQMCIRTAKEMGAIDDNTFIIAVEEDKKTANKIQKYLDTLPNKSYIHRKSLRYFHKIAAVLDGKKIDCAFFDFCGLVDLHSTNWIMKHRKNFATGCVIGYTIANNTRISDFLDAFRQDCFPKHGIKKQCHKSRYGMIHVDTAAVSDFDYTDEKRIKVAKRRDKYIQISREVISLMFGVDCHMDSMFSYRDTKVGMTTMVGELKGKKEFSTFYKFNEYITGLFPKKRRAKHVNMVELTTAEKRKSLMQDFIAKGIKNNGLLKVSAGHKAALTRYTNALSLNIIHTWSYIKIAIGRKTGVKTIVETIPMKRSR
jgi:hypothetical protein